MILVARRKETGYNIMKYKDEGGRLVKAIALLLGKYREVLLFKYAQGYSMDEIAMILSMSKENVKKIIQRARKKLEKQLSEEA